MKFVFTFGANTLEFDGAASDFSILQPFVNQWIDRQMQPPGVVQALAGIAGAVNSADQDIKDATKTLNTAAGGE